MRRHIRVNGIVIVAALSIACGRTPSSSEVSGSLEEQEQDRIEEFWEEKVAVVQTAIDGTPSGPLNIDEFTEAVEFFERTTGIDSHTGTFFGRYPIDGLDEILEQYKAWYADHRDRLYWDDAGQTVRSKDQTESERVEEFWYEKINVVLKAASWTPEQANPEEYSEAVEFLEEITGIQPQAGTLQGRTPGPDFDETFDSWFAWYAENKDRLYWDESAQTVRLKKNE